MSEATMTSNPYSPAELVLFSTPIGLNSLGAVFSIDAPFAACRLCGAIYQSQFDRLCRSYLEEGRIVEVYDPITRTSKFMGDFEYMNVLDKSTDRRRRWRLAHERRHHTDEEIEAFTKTGFAFTPEAAHKLAPFGVTPLGGMHPEIDDALLSAPRAPSDDAEN